MRAHLFEENQTTGHRLPIPEQADDSQDEDQTENKQKTRLDKALLAFLITCSVAFNVLINPHFLMFVRLLNKQYKVPSPYVLSNRLLDSEYAIVMSAIKQELSKAQGVSLTLDPWKSKSSGYSYLG